MVAMQEIKRIDAPAAQNGNGNGESDRPAGRELQESEKDLEYLGETVLQLHKGELILREPSWADIRKTRVHAARLAMKEPSLYKADPGLTDMDYISHLVILCTTSYTPRGGEQQADLNLNQLEAFGASDYRKVSTALQRYMGNESS